MENKKRLLFAVGGTGGHLFPAQALARQIHALDPSIEILFVGSKLSTNLYFLRQEFTFQEIASSSLSKNPIKLFNALKALAKGTAQSYALLKEFSPDLVVGFGSFHAFPTLFAASVMHASFMLFEPNLHAGKVNKIFSKRSILNSLQFSETAKEMKGVWKSVKMPLWSASVENKSYTQAEAKAFYGLKSDEQTLLIFGGSQGAAWINEWMACFSLSSHCQVIHLAGNDKECINLEQQYKKRKIHAAVKPFEQNMHLAWTAADLAICRAGASTLAELITYEKPALLIPYPYAHGHQKRNGEFFQETVRGGFYLEQAEINEQNFADRLKRLQEQKELFKSNIQSFKQNEKKEDFAELILNFLENKR